MHDMTARVAAISGHNRSPNFLKHQRWFPTIYDLRARLASAAAALRLRVRRRRRRRRHRHQAQLGGARRDRDGAALRRDAGAAAGRRRAVRPQVHRADRHRADGQPDRGVAGRRQAVRRGGAARGVPYTLGCAGGATIEEIAEIAPDVFWFQLYRFAKNDHAIGFDLVKRAEAAGVQVLMLTLDVPVRTIRAREVKVGLGGGGAFRADWRMIAGMLKCPGWPMAMLKQRPCRASPTSSPMPARTRASTTPSASRARRWAARSPGRRSRAIASSGRGRWWSRASCIRPTPRRRCRSASTAFWCRTTAAARSRRCRRRSTACRRSAKAVGSKATVLFDSGVRSGTDVARALALGAHAALAGKAFLWGLGALGAEGPGHVIDLFIDELQSALGQIGAHSPAEAQERGAPASGRLRLRAQSSLICVQRQWRRAKASARTGAFA